MKVLKLWENDKIQVEFTRDELESLATAYDACSEVKQKDPVEHRAFVYNLERVCFQNKPAVFGQDYEKIKEGCKVGVHFTNKYEKIRDGLKTCCKIKGVNCPHNIRYDSWGLKTPDDFGEWDEKVKTRCVNCEHNIDMLAVTD